MDALRTHFGPNPEQFRFHVDCEENCMGPGWIGHEVHVGTLLNQIGGMWNPGTRWMGSRWDAYGVHVSAKKTPFGIHTETMCSLAFRDEASMLNRMGSTYTPSRIHRGSMWMRVECISEPIQNSFGSMWVAKRTVWVRDGSDMRSMWVPY